MESELKKAFGEKCKAQNLPMNVVLEMLVRLYLEDEVELSFKLKPKKDK